MGKRLTILLKTCLLLPITRLPSELREVRDSDGCTKENQKLKNKAEDF